MKDIYSLERIKTVYLALEELGDDVIFVGGSAVSLYAERPVFQPRPTEDVDIVVEITTRKKYIEFEDMLRSKGFAPDPTAGFIGRYIIDGIKTDVMPVIAEVLGFSNKWYKDGILHAETFVIDDECTVRIFSAPYFIATKMEAFKARGVNDDGEPDGRFSHDFEDIIFVLEHRNSVWDEINNSPGTLKEYLINECKALLSNPYFEEWVDGYAGYSSPPFTKIIIDKLQKLVAGV